MTSKILVTVLAGLLVSGKTTLFNRLLSENRGKRIAVIETEYGETDVGNNFIIDAEEGIIVDPLFLELNIHSNGMAAIGKNDGVIASFAINPNS